MNTTCRGVPINSRSVPINSGTYPHCHLLRWSEVEEGGEALEKRCYLTSKRTFSNSMEEYPVTHIKPTESLLRSYPLTPREDKSVTVPAVTVGHHA